MDKKYTYLFKNALIFNGSESPPYKADVAIKQNVICAIGNLSAVESDEVFDLEGKALAPGFIDVHTHDDNAVLQSPDCLAKISQGVSTVIVGNCGLSVAPVRLSTEPPDPLNLLGNQSDFIFKDFKSYVAAINERKPAVNVAALVGHTSLRVNHMDDLYREATSDELVAMKDELDACMQEGAIGLSTGLAYATARDSSTEEIIALAKVLAKNDGIYVTHLRNEFDQVIEAIEESFTIAESGDIPLIISHLKCAGPDNWGRSDELLKFIENSSYSHRVHMDCYPYAAGSSTLDLGQVDERVEILITWSETHPEKSTQYLHEIAKDWGLSQYEAAEKLKPAGAVYFSISEEDMKKIISHPKTMIGSDGLPHDPHPHPRLWGTFPRVIGRLAREQKLMSMSTAIHKMTALSAKNYKLEGRGQIAIGSFADLVVFDPERVADTATFDKPISMASGIEQVYVNGVLSFEKGRSTNQRAGIYVGAKQKSNI
ncbi:D-aminoacylase [Lentisphaera profundi]|uniref:D-aminoacylase n=1 Tax=Lentisphaera profundi TaxID=1658616 RepID=A0ABY7W198_9BACT|nr:D-aminoacylase [Lentisphaera profundi]WDE99248.1 D-aminoacylase [Lentisphaera profundi]